MQSRVLEGRGVIVTGTSQGLGVSIARACVEAGAHVCLCARDGAALEKVRREIAALAADGQQVLALETDVSQPAAVEALVETAVRGLPNVTGIVNNAGVLGPKDRAAEADWEAWYQTIGINLLGTVLCCRAVLPVLQRAGYGKIVNLSGGGATAPMPNMSAYAASKAAVVRFTETIAVEYAADGIDVNAIAPGALNTRMLEEVLAAGPEKVGQSYYDRSVRQKQEGGASLARAAALCVFLLGRQSDGISGRLLSAVWDPWETLAGHAAELKTSDVYTLRRIVPKDRGFDWDKE